MIRMADVTVTFGGVTALHGLTLDLEAQVTGIIGPNGAGKTTFLNVLSGFVTPRSGSITAFGTELLAMKPYQRARWGLRRSFQREQVVDELTVADNIRVMLDPGGFSRAEAGRMLGDVLAFAGMEGVADTPAAGLNAFQRRMTELARAAVGRPRLILLDEPGAGFSQAEVGRLRDVIAGLAGFCGAQVFLIDHDVDLIQAVCPACMVLDFGRLIAHGPTPGVLADARVRAVYLGTEEVA